MSTQINLSSKQIKRIKNKILGNIKNICLGFEIVHEELDGYDEDGATFWTCCKNGYTCRDGYIYPELILRIQTYLQEIISYGIIYNNQKIYLDPAIYFEKFTYRSRFKKPVFRIKILSENEHKQDNTFLSKYPTIKENVCKNLEKLQNERNEDIIYLKSPHIIKAELERAMNASLKTTEEDFELSMKYLLESCFNLRSVEQFNDYVKPFL